MNKFTAVLVCSIAYCLPLLSGCDGAAQAKSDKTSVKTKAPKYVTLEIAKGVTMKMAQIPAGEFMMGNKLTPEQTVKSCGGKKVHYAN